MALCEASSGIAAGESNNHGCVCVKPVVEQLQEKVITMAVCVKPVVEQLQEKVITMAVCEASSGTAAGESNNHGCV